MKKKYYIFTAISAYLIVLIATIPANSISQLVDEDMPISLQGVNGTLWKGNARTITINNDIQLKNTSWDFHAWKLLTGRAVIDLNTHYLDNAFISEVGSSFLGKVFINNLTGKLPASELAQLANMPLVQLDGTIDINIEHAEWQENTLPMATGNINWRLASVTVAESVSLGNLTITLGESDNEQLNANIINQGGDIKINGNAELVPETNYAVNIKLSPTATASDNIKRSLGMFAKRQTNGDFVFINEGSLNQIGLM